MHIAKPLPKLRKWYGIVGGAQPLPL